MMRSGFVVSVLSITLFCGCAQKVAVKNIDSSGSTIVCFGDSITFGYGAASGTDYPSLLAASAPCAVVNAGIDGDTSSEALKRLGTDVLDRNPLLVIIEFGGNDFLRQIPVETTAANIRQMVRQIQDAGAMVAVVDIGTEVLLREYHRAFRKIAIEEGAIFVPWVLSGILINSSLKSDFIHPNSAGYTLIAQRIQRVVLPYVQHNRQLRSKQ